MDLSGVRQATRTELPHLPARHAVDLPAGRAAVDGRPVPAHPETVTLAGAALELGAAVIGRLALSSSLPSSGRPRRTSTHRPGPACGHSFTRLRRGRGASQARGDEHLAGRRAHRGHQVRVRVDAARRGCGELSRWSQGMHGRIVSRRQQHGNRILVAAIGRVVTALRQDLGQQDPQGYGEDETGEDQVG